MSDYIIGTLPGGNGSRYALELSTKEGRMTLTTVDYKRLTNFVITSRRQAIQLATEILLRVGELPEDNG